MCRDSPHARMHAREEPGDMDLKVCLPWFPRNAVRLPVLRVHQPRESRDPDSPSASPTPAACSITVDTRAYIME